MAEWFGSWPRKCDLCGADLTKEVFFVDGVERRSMKWALIFLELYQVN